MPESILITGGSGFIGRHLVQALLQEGHQVTSLCRTRPPKGVEWIPWDLSKGLLPDRLPRSDTIVHLAQSEYFREFPNQALDVLNINTIIAAKLLDFGLKTGAKRFTLTSSGGVYGHGDRAFTEMESPAASQELGYYLGAKHCAEILADCYRYHMSVHILRLFFVYGVEQRSTMLIPRLFRSILHGEPITLSGPDGIRINPIHVSDAVRYIQKTLGLRESEKLNIAGEQVVTLRELCGMIGSIVGRPPIFLIAEQETRNLVGDTAKITRLFGKPLVHLHSGISEIAEKLR